MKTNLFLLFTILFYSLCLSQTVVNDNKDVKIIFPFENVKYSPEKKYLFTVKNESNINYIIDTYYNSFLGVAEIHENGKFLHHILYYPEGFHAERNYGECVKDFEIIQKGAERNILLPIFKYGGKYKIDDNNLYEIIITNQSFTKGISKVLGCEKYIEEMESKNYKVLEGNINIKLKLVP